MARYEHLPIYRAAFDLAVHVEKIVRNFSRYHRYSLGTELREGSRRIVERIMEANHSRERAALLRRLRLELEQLKVLVRLCHESGGFASTRAYLYVAEQVVGISRQNEGWLRQALKDDASARDARPGRVGGPGGGASSGEGVRPGGVVGPGGVVRPGGVGGPGGGVSSGEGARPGGVVGPGRNRRSEGGARSGAAAGSGQTASTEQAAGPGQAAGMGRAAGPERDRSGEAGHGQNRAG